MNELNKIYLQVFCKFLSIGVKFVNIKHIRFLVLLVFLFACDTESPDTSSTRELKLSFIVVDNSPCELSFGSGCKIVVNIWGLDKTLISKQEFLSNDISPSGEIEVDAPISGDFAISVNILGDCNSCCANSCLSTQLGQPMFTGVQDQVQNRDYKLQVLVHYETCVCSCF